LIAGRQIVATYRRIEKFVEIGGVLPLRFRDTVIAMVAVHRV